MVDSQTTAGGLGFMVLAAAKAAREGANAEGTAAHVAEARGEFKLWFAIDTLEFLKRGGRIGAASAWIGSTLKVKPILTVEGEMTPVERVRTSSRAFERMVDYARQRQDSGAERVVRAAHQRARPVRRAGRALQRGVRPRAHDRERDRPGAGRPHRPGPARHRGPPGALHRVGAAPGGANTALMPAAREIVRIVLIVVCVAITLYLLFLLRRPITWLLISIFLAVALSPPVNALAMQHAARARHHDRLPRPARGAARCSSR